MSDADRRIRTACRLLRRRKEIVEDRNRAIAELYLAEGTEYGGTLSHVQIARRYGLTETTVRNAVHAWVPVIEAERAASGSDAPVAV
jgi:hypothetical protein